MNFIFATRIQVKHVHLQDKKSISWKNKNLQKTLKVQQWFTCTNQPSPLPCSQCGMCCKVKKNPTCSTPHRPRQGCRQASKWAACDLTFAFILHVIFLFQLHLTLPPLRTSPHTPANAEKKTLMQKLRGCRCQKKQNIPAVSRRYLRRP